MDRYLAEKDHQACYIDRICYDGWYHATCNNKQVSTVYQKVSIMRRFLLYTSSMGIECYVPRLPKKHKSEYVPYIFTENEINNLFTATDNLREKEHHAIVLDNTKNGRQRLAPLNESLEKALRQYIHYRNCYPSKV